MYTELTVLQAFQEIAPSTMPPPALRDAAARALMQALAMLPRRPSFEPRILEDARSAVLLNLLRVGPRGERPTDPQTDRRVTLYLERAVVRSAVRLVTACAPPTGSHHPDGRSQRARLQSFDEVRQDGETPNALDRLRFGGDPQETRAELDLRRAACELVARVADSMATETRVIGGRSVTVGEGLGILNGLATGERTWDGVTAELQVQRNTLEVGLGRLRLALLAGVRASDEASQDPELSEAADDWIREMYAVTRRHKGSHGTPGGSSEEAP